VAIKQQHLYFTESMNGIVINDVSDHVELFYIEKHKHSGVNIKQKPFLEQCSKIHQSYRQIYVILLP